MQGKVMNSTARGRRWGRLAICLTALILQAAVAGAKTLYVDVNGNDGTTYDANSSSAPWRSIGRAAWGSTNRAAPNAGQAARAGDTVIVRAGTYTTAGTDDRWNVAYNPVNNGSAGAPIVFQAEGTVVLTLSSSRGPVIGAWTRNYIVWRGFTVNEAQAPTHADTGVAVLTGTTGSAIENCILDGNGDPGYGDNHPGIRFEYAKQSAARNNLIKNFRTSVVNTANGAGIQVYFSGDLVIENNEITDSGSGIFLKAPADENVPNWIDQFIVRYNRIARTQYGIAMHRSPNTAARPARIYQNIVTDSMIAIRIWNFSGDGTDPANGQFVNNTLYNNQESLNVNGTLVPNSGHYFWNNVVANSTIYAVNNDGPVANMAMSKINSQHNLHWSFRRFGIVWTTNYNTIGEWQAGTGMDTQAPASTSADPLFVNAAAGDFRLAANSPARTGGVDLLDLNFNGSTSDGIPRGAYITGNEVIGRGGSVSTLAPPRAPTNLRLISQ